MGDAIQAATPRATCLPLAERRQQPIAAGPTEQIPETPVHMGQLIDRQQHVQASSVRMPAIKTWYEEEPNR